MENKEKYIIQTIKSHQEDIDTDALWGNILSEIPKEEKKRRAIWWWFGGAALLIAGFLLWSTNTPSASTPVASNAPVNTPKRMALDVKSSKKETNSLESVENDKSKKINRNDTKNGGIQEVEYNPVISRSTSKSINKSTEKVESDVITESALNQNKSSQILLANNFKDNAEDSDQINTNVKENVLKTQNLEKVKSRHIIRILDLGNDEIKALEHQTHVSINDPKVTPYALVDDIVKMSRWSYFVNAGVSKTSRTLMTDDPELGDEKDRRASVERVIGGWSIEAGAEYRLTPDMTAGIGVSLLQIHEEAGFQATTIVENDVVEEVNTTFLQNGDVNIAYGTLSTEVITEEVRNNQFRFIEIPVYVRQRVYSIGATDISLEGHFAYSLSQSRKGFSSMKTQSPAYNLSEDIDGKFASSRAIRYGAGITLLRKLSDVAYGMLGIHYSKIKGINSSNYLIDQQYNSITFKTGFIKKF